MLTNDMRTTKNSLGLALGLCSGISILVVSTNDGQEPPAVNPNLAVATAVSGLIERAARPEPGRRDAAAMALREMGPDDKARIRAGGRLCAMRTVISALPPRHTLERMVRRRGGEPRAAAPGL